MKKYLIFFFVLAISISVLPSNIGSKLQGVSLGVDKYQDLYLLDFSSGIVHHIDSETGIYLGEFHSSESLGAESFTDISVCACGGGIGLLDSVNETIWVVDFSGDILWKKDNTDPDLSFSESLSLAICQDSNHEHLILGTSTGELFHVSPPGEIDGKFKNTPKIPFGKISGVYMDYIKQVFIADTENSRIVKTDQWGSRIIGECGEGILDEPVDVATSEDNDRRIWVADRGTKSLHVFSRELKYLFECGESILTDPLTVICDYLDAGCYVAEIVDGIVYLHKFDKNGVHLFTLKNATTLPIQKLLSTTANSFVLYNRSGENIALKNKPKLEGGEYFIEARPLFESFEFLVTWNEIKRCASISKDEFVTTIFIDSSTIQTDSGSFEIVPKVQISKSKLLVPFSFINEYFDITAEVKQGTLFLVHPRLSGSQKLPEPNIGEQLFESKCGKCHNLPAPETKARNDWEPIVKRMQLKDPNNISESEAERISRFLWGLGFPE